MKISSAFVVGLAAAFLMEALPYNKAWAEGICDRIVSLAPSVTESLYRVGLGDKIVGVSKYDRFPAEVKKKKQIGGFLDPNLETISSLHPSIIFALTEHKDTVENLNKLQLKSVLLEHRNVQGILDGFDVIGHQCGVEEIATKVRTELSDHMLTVRKEVENLPRTRALVVVSRTYESKGLRDIYLSGKDGYYDALIEIAGGINLFKSITSALSSSSIEGIRALDPDVIIELIPPYELEKRSMEELLKPWREASLIRAANNNKVFIVADDFATIPGPRFVLLLDRLKKILH